MMNKVLVLFNLTFLFIGITASVIGPLVPIIAQDLEIGFDVIGMFFLFGSLSSLAAVFVLGWISDRYNVKITIIIATVILFTGLLLFGSILNPITLISAIILLRSGRVLIDSSLRTYIINQKTNDHSRIFIRFAIFWCIGAISGPLIVSTLLYLDLDYRYIFLILSVFFIIILVFLLIIFRAKKTVKGTRHAENKVYSFKMGKIFNTVTVIDFILLALMGGILGGVSEWLTTYFLTFDLEVYFSSLFLSLYWVFTLAGLVIINRLLRVTNEITLLLFGFVIATVSLIFFNIIDVILVKVVLLAVQAMALSGGLSLVMAISAYENKKNSGVIMSFNLAAAVIGSIVFQPIFGYVAEHFYKDYIMYIILAASFLATCLIILLLKMANRKNIRLRIF